jgi:hypothetical protein
MPKIVFEPLPPRVSRPKRRTRELATITAALRQTPGAWARIGTYRTPASAASMASMIRHGRRPAFGPEGTFEAAARTVDGQHRVYARYVGDTPAGGEQQ